MLQTKIVNQDRSACQNEKILPLLKDAGSSLTLCYVCAVWIPTSLIIFFHWLRKQSEIKEQLRKIEEHFGNTVGFNSVDPVSDQTVSCSEKGSGHLLVLLLIPTWGGLVDFMAGKDDHGVSEDNDSRIPAESDAESCVKEQAGGSWEELTSVIAAEVKVFAVVVLALCTTSPPIGITLSAFLFLFPESTGKHFSCLTKICWNVKSGLQYMAKRIGYAILVLTSDVSIVKEKSDDGVFELVEPEVESESDVSDSSIEEIEAVEVQSRARVCFDEGSSQKTSLIEYLIVDDEKWKKIDAGDHTDDLSVTVGMKSKSKRRRKLVPKMGAEFIKKIVPKKLRKKSKKHQSLGTELEPKPISLNKLIS